MTALNPSAGEELDADIALLFAYLQGLLPVDSIAGQRVIRLKREVRALIATCTLQAVEAFAASLLAEQEYLQCESCKGAHLIASVRVSAVDAALARVREEAK